MLQANHDLVELKFLPDEVTGSGAFATATIPSDARLVSCPFELAVTSQRAKDALCSLLGIGEASLVWPVGTALEGQKFNHRMLIGAYLGLHWVYLEDKGSQVYVPLNQSGVGCMRPSFTVSSCLGMACRTSFSMAYISHPCQRMTACKRLYTSLPRSEIFCGGQTYMAPQRTENEIGGQSQMWCGQS